MMVGATLPELHYDPKPDYPRYIDQHVTIMENYVKISLYSQHCFLFPYDIKVGHRGICKIISKQQHATQVWITLKQDSTNSYKVVGPP